MMVAREWTAALSGKMVRVATLSAGVALAPLAASPVMAQSLGATGPNSAAIPTTDELATLLADKVQIEGQSTLVASGNVQVYYHSNRLTATRVVYDRSKDTLRIEGPIRLEQPGRAGSIIVASQAELSPDLRTGILLSARMVMARELQLAAASIERKSDTLTVMNRVVTSSCRVCTIDPTPLWEIRARKVESNTQTRQITFYDAQFRAFGVPVAYLPRLRMPAPGVRRMSGLLRPSIRTTSGLGVGLKLPYFFALGPSRDLTVTPYIAGSYTRTLGLRYRQAYNWGNLELSGAASRDSIRKGVTRGYLFGNLDATLPDDFKLDAQLRLVSDDAYLLNYGISDTDRLWSGVNLERVRRNELITLRAGNTHTIRADESNSIEPMLSGTAQWVRSFSPGQIGGLATLRLSTLAARRASDSLLDSNGDGIPDGRDMVRGSFTADWQRNWLLPGGVLGSIQAQYAADIIETKSDPNFPRTILRGQPTLATELRWPWVKSSGRAAYVIEPIAQLVFAPNRLKASPNEDSTLPELDEGNLFSLSRFPGEDARETGLRANLGLGWTRYDASGWSLGVVAGRVFRQRDLGQFAPETSIGGIRSDWMVSSHLSLASGLTLANRMLFDDDFTVSREEMRLAWQAKRYQVSAGYLWLEANAAEMRPDPLSELELATTFKIKSDWSGSFGTRYDFTANRAARADLGLTYTNECLQVDLSLSRRFTSSTSVSPETDLGLSVQLVGFGASNGAAVARSCAR
ncbi:LPS-assembly protein LptD [Thioclava sp. BHET1]|nr:LPS-assembly protein LptD [Thioclava sp. BHET1]